MLVALMMCLLVCITVRPCTHQPDLWASQVVINIWTYRLYRWTDDDVRCYSGLLHSLYNMIYTFIITLITLFFWTPGHTQDDVTD